MSVIGGTFQRHGAVTDKNNELDIWAVIRVGADGARELWRVFYLGDGMDELSNRTPKSNAEGWVSQRGKDGGRKGAFEAVRFVPEIQEER